ncbi:MAG TPA: DMT family transporter [Pseudonocardiaceae bacterium]
MTAISIWPAVAAALGASTCGATASALQHRTAVQVIDRRGLGPVVRATVTHRSWLAAVALQGFGFLLHAMALHFGQLTVVQPLLVCAVLFALPLNRLLRKERITPREVGWATVLVVGLAGFLLAGTPATQPPAQPVDIGPAAVFGIAGLVAVGGCAILARRIGVPSAAAVLGVAAGILFAAQAALLKSSVEAFGHGLGALVTAWQPYALLVVGAAAVVFSQLAFRAGPLSASLPLVATVNPTLGVLIGVVVYDEGIRDSGPALTAEIAFLTLLVVATLVLTRLEQAAPRHHFRWRGAAGRAGG